MPSQRQEATTAAGLPFTRLSLSQQQTFIALGCAVARSSRLTKLAGATLRVAYPQPGAFQWGQRSARGDRSGFYTRWVIPLGPGPQDPRVPRPPVVERTREEALAAVRRVDPRLREALLQAVRRADAHRRGPLRLRAQQIFPTQLDLWCVSMPGPTNERPIDVITHDMKGERSYRGR
jgi:hypothetical protein